MECYKRTERALRVLCLQNILGAALYCNNISAEGPTVQSATHVRKKNAMFAAMNGHATIVTLPYISPWCTYGKRSSRSSTCRARRTGPPVPTARPHIWSSSETRSSRSSIAVCQSLPSTPYACPPRGICGRMGCESTDAWEQGRRAIARADDEVQDYAHHWHGTDQC
jgi:hypothetical protein